MEIFTDKWSNKLCFLFKKRKSCTLELHVNNKIIMWIVVSDIKTLPKLYLTNIQLYSNLSLQHAKIMFAYK